VAVLWRKDKEKMHYDFLPGGWHSENDEQFNQGISALGQMVEQYLERSKMTLPLVMFMHHDMNDEHIRVSFHQSFSKQNTVRIHCSPFTFASAVACGVGMKKPGKNSAGFFFSYLLSN
jgi:hypothetical protein